LHYKNNALKPAFLNKKSTKSPTSIALRNLMCIFSGDGQLKYFE
jgi:hypothetical protein